MSNVYPTFADPVTWSSSTAYDPFKIVLYDGHAYTSKQAVPAGTALNNTDYWIPTGNIYKLMNDNITALQSQITLLNTALEGKTNHIIKDNQNGNTATFNVGGNPALIFGARLNNSFLVLAPSNNETPTVVFDSNNVVTSVTKADGTISIVTNTSYGSSIRIECVY